MLDVGLWKEEHHVLLLWSTKQASLRKTVSKWFMCIMYLERSLQGANYLEVSLKKIMMKVHKGEDQ